MPLLTNFIEHLSDKAIFAINDPIARAPSAYEDGDVDWQGHCFWANLGFENTEHVEFKEWALARRRQESTLNQLVQTEEGRQLWKKEGFTWIAEFILANAHPCFSYLRRHLERKGINVNW